MIAGGTPGAARIVFDGEHALCSPATFVGRVVPRVHTVRNGFCPNRSGIPATLDDHRRSHYGITRT